MKVRGRESTSQIDLRSHIKRNWATVTTFINYSTPNEPNKSISDVICMINKNDTGLLQEGKT